MLPYDHEGTRLSEDAASEHEASADVGWQKGFVAYLGGGNNLGGTLNLGCTHTLCTHTVYSHTVLTHCTHTHTHTYSYLYASLQVGSHSPAAPAAVGAAAVRLVVHTVRTHCTHTYSYILIRITSGGAFDALSLNRAGWRVAYVANDVINCAMSPWGEWDACSHSCGGDGRYCADILCSYTVLISLCSYHCAHTTVLIPLCSYHCAHTTVLIHRTHTLYSYNVLIHYTPSILIHYTHHLTGPVASAVSWLSRVLPACAAVLSVSRNGAPTSTASGPGLLVCAAGEMMRLNLLIHCTHVLYSYCTHTPYSYSVLTHGRSGAIKWKPYGSDGLYMDVGTGACTNRYSTTHTIHTLHHTNTCATPTASR
jgi:hypothetical protein